jgi:hypothetical protein
MYPFEAETTKLWGHLQIFTFSGEGDFDRIFGVDNNRYLPQLCVVDVRKARP